VFTPISPAFEYVEIAMNWFWPTVGMIAAFGLGWIARSCEMPSKV
jgi:hypothetical protein